MVDTMITLDIVWVLLCSFLVALMQAGFTCLESGMVRNKNSINVAVKNLVDFCIAGTLFSCVGYGLMFGPSTSGIHGMPTVVFINDVSTKAVTFFIFQMMFVGTAATIISGAVSERMSFLGYIIITVLVTGFIYPIAGHWVWNGLLEGSRTGWLEKMGFMDFAGATVVHSTAGWVALAAILIIGPRIGRYGENGREITGHNLPMSTLGVFLLWFGFFGFNAGSALGLALSLPNIIASTALSGAAGGVMALLASWVIWKHPSITRIINGVIAGLVSICAASNIIPIYSSLVIGGVAGLLCVGGMWLLDHYEIDDVIGAIPAHLCSGIWGSLAFIAFVSEEELETGSYGSQLAVQALGISVIGIFTFTVSYVFINLINRIIPFRVPEAEELVGLNISEHKVETPLLDLITQMNAQSQHGDFSQPVIVEGETEASNIATFYNSVLERFHNEVVRRQDLLEKLYHMSNYDELTELPNRHMFFEELSKVHTFCENNKTKSAVLFMDIDGFKAINDTYGHAAGDELLKSIATRLKSLLRSSDVVARLGGDEFCLIMDNIKDASDTELVGKRIIRLLSSPFMLSCGSINVGVSVGVCIFDAAKEQITQEEMVQRADNAMYEAKLAGKGTLRIA